MSKDGEYKMQTGIRHLMPNGKWDWEEKEDKYRVDLNLQVKKPEILLEKEDIKYGSVQPVMCRLFTAGNFSVITGKGKSKKTFLTTLLTSMIISGASKFKFHPAKSDTVIFDTEQGDYDAWKVGNRVRELSETDGFNMFALRDMDHKERCKFIADYIKNNKPKFIVIDGIADLVYSINEEQEAIRIQQCLLTTTKQYRCHILCIIHQNKADNFATGFLGSALIKKAEIIISIQQDKKIKSMSNVSCEHVRGTMDFEDFLIDIQNGLPVIIDRSEVKDKGEMAPIPFHGKK